MKCQFVKVLICAAATLSAASGSAASPQKTSLRSYTCTNIPLAGVSYNAATAERVFVNRTIRARTRHEAFLVYAKSVSGMGEIVYLDVNHIRVLMYPQDGGQSVPIREFACDPSADARLAQR